LAEVIEDIHYLSTEKIEEVQNAIKKGTVGNIRLNMSYCTKRAVCVKRNLVMIKKWLTS